MVSETIERSAFVLSHSKFPDYHRVILKKSTTCLSKLLNKLNSTYYFINKFIQLDKKIGRLCCKNYRVNGTLKFGQVGAA